MPLPLKPATIRYLMLGTALAAAGWFFVDSLGRTGPAGDMPADIIIADERDALPSGTAGAFLSSYHAQQQYDWDAAQKHLSQVLSQDGESAELLKRAMVLAMGSGDLENGARWAERLIARPEDEGAESMAHLILTVRDIGAGNLAAAESHIAEMAPGDMSDYIKPLLSGWVAAGQGRYDVNGFNQTTVHLYHAANISLFMQKPDQAKMFAARMETAVGLGPVETERLADLFAATGEMQKALALYGKLVAAQGDKGIERKIAALRGGEADLSTTNTSLAISAPAQGAALVMFDMAYILYNEQTDSSSKLFAHMALALDPNLTEARILLGDIMARNGRLQDSIAMFLSVPPAHESYIEARRYAATLQAEAGEKDEARATLTALFKEHNDIESLIKIGDMYRADEDYRSAISYYDQAEKSLGTDSVPEDYWHLLYARGMAYEREGSWSKAETDLKAALAYRPDHPYLMNYLAYGWADQGVNLDESLQLLERAVNLRPDDGYIADSLGWVLFRLGRFSESIPPLERAVELLPYDSTINDHLGDAYWRVGRRIEARFQWQRALEAAEDEKQAKEIGKKLEEGLAALPPARDRILTRP